MNFAWLFLAVLSGFFDVGYNTLSRFALKDGEKSVHYAWIFSVFRSILFLIPALFFSQFVPTSKGIMILILLGAANFLNISLFMKMHSLNHLSASSIISRLRMVWVPLISFAILGERLLAKEYLGIAVLFLAVFLIISPKRLIRDKAVTTALFFSLTAAVVTILLKVAAEVTTTPMIIFAMSFPTALLLPFLKNKREEIFKDWRKDFGQKILITGLSILLLYTFIWALELGGTVSKVNAIFQSTAALSVFSGMIFLKEREDLWHRVAGAGLIVAGALLLI